tara:strand:+ start:264 stop:776 length:513 start_codon:yes stop_codon:yes gene_type:complete
MASNDIRDVDEKIIVEKEIILKCYKNKEFIPPLGEVCRDADKPIVDFVYDTLSSFSETMPNSPLQCFVSRTTLIRIRSTAFVKNGETVFVCVSADYSSMAKKIEREQKKVLVADDVDATIIMKSDPSTCRPGNFAMGTIGGKRSRNQMGSNTQERLEYHLANKNNPEYPR